MPPFEDFPKSHRVAYKYYTAQLAFLDEKYGEAKEDFEYAFYHCQKSCIKNKIRILHFLIPTMIFFGRRPSVALLKRYGMEKLYAPLIDALHHGKLHKFQEYLTNFQTEKFFSKIGTILIWEKLSLVVYRQLFLKTYQILGCNSRIPFSSINKALLVAEYNVNIDEVECLLCNLIDKNLMKGYLSHERQFLVLSQKEPFPSINKHTII
ncbi:hypothetical protein ROZALSC1DRAFT_10834 [Rozella allomycis CSF55]|nr:hypothetical protein ROZALSC1DRAFT_10834 [Rozella allomycis CSF55]